MVTKVIDNKKVLVVVDVQNLYFSARNVYGKVKLDFGKLLSVILHDRQVDDSDVIKWAFIVSTNNQESRNFRIALEKRHKFKIFSKTVPGDRVVGGPDDPGTDWDVALSLEVAEYFRNNNVGIFILASGDGDFMDLITFLKDRYHFQAEVASFRSSASHFLVKSCDHFYQLDDGILMRNDLIPA